MEIKDVCEIRCQFHVPELHVVAGADQITSLKPHFSKPKSVFLHASTTPISSLHKLNEVYITADCSPRVKPLWLQHLYTIRM